MLLPLFGAGMGFRDSMRERVLIPLGMTSRDSRWTPKIDARAATPYDERARPIGGPHFTAQVAASLQPGAADLARFLIAGMPGFATTDAPRRLKAETVAEMHTAQPAADGGYGLGYSVEERQGIKLVGRGGANQGWMAQIMFVLASGSGVIVMTNGSNGNRLIAPILRAWQDSLEPPAAEEASAGR